MGPEVYKTVAAMEAGMISDPVYQTNRILSNDPRLLRGGFAISAGSVARTLPASGPSRSRLDELRAAWARQNTAELERQVQTAILDDAGFELVRLPAPDELAAVIAIPVSRSLGSRWPAADALGLAGVSLL